MTGNPHVGVVVDLVDPYYTPSAKQVGSRKSSTAASRRVVAWLRSNPGRWAITAEGATGLTRQVLRDYPDIFATENRSAHLNPDGIPRTYAQVPHPLGEPLKDALARRALPGGPALYLPDLERDPFDWSPAELAEACQVARDNLFPVA